MNVLIAQCGGPTPVFNASLSAAIQQWQQRFASGKIFGSRYGLQGLATADWVDLTALTPAVLATLAQQPAAALGSSRYRPSAEDFPKMVADLQRAQIGAVLLIGGNGTMAAGQRLAATADEQGIPLQVLGIPKTIDNDLAGTDVSPGYGSAARYIAYTTQEISLDLCAMRNFDQVAVVEIMGRHAGWLAAASALARTLPGDPPHLILTPEVPVDLDHVLQRIAAVFEHTGICVIAAAEGIHNRNGQYWAELLGSAGQDASGQKIFSMSVGVSAFLVQQVQQHLGLRCRQIRLNTTQRSTRLLASPVDRELARHAAVAAVDACAGGRAGMMVALRHTADGWRTAFTPVDAVIGRERALPADFIDPAAYSVTPACTAYISTVIGEPPPAPILWTEQ